MDGRCGAALPGHRPRRMERSDHTLEADGGRVDRSAPGQPRSRRRCEPRRWRIPRRGQQPVARWRADHRLYPTAELPAGWTCQRLYRETERRVDAQPDSGVCQADSPDRRHERRSVARVTAGIAAIIVAGLVGQQSLSEAVLYGQTQTVRELIAGGADVNEKDNEGRTALMAAATNGEIGVVQALLAGGADVSAADAAGGTAATYAAASGQADILDALKKRGARVGNRELMLAASECHTGAVNLLLASGLAVHGGGEGDPPILVAASRNCVETVRLLLDRGADVNAKDHDGWTPLIKAASGGLTELARLLLERGADMDVVDKLERTASMYAALPGHEAIAALFKDARERKR